MQSIDSAEITLIGQAPDYDERLSLSEWQIISDFINELHNADGLAIALETLSAAIDASPRDGALLVILGRLFAASGRRADAFAAFSSAMEIGTGFETLHLMAEAAFPGPRYYDHLLALHRLIEPKNYLEIGVFRGDTLALARPGTNAIGVDPDPRPEAARAYATPTRIHRMTSDAFFARDVEHADVVEGNVDLSFIDGLHVYEQVLQDFINVERHCHPGSLVVLHDTLPVAASAAERDRRTSHWCGDVWKMLSCLRKYRPELSIRTIPTHPSGLTLIAGLDPGSQILANCFDEAVAEFLDAPIPRECLAMASEPDLANDFEAVRTWVSDRLN